MTNFMLKLLHASALHVDRTLAGVAHLPEALVELFADAPRRTAERIFDAAVEHEVDALLLSGDVLDLKRASPADLEFIHNQFRRLAEHKISVFWLGGRSERKGKWPEVLPLPETVFCFHGERPHAVPLVRDAETVAVVAGAAGAPDPAGIEAAMGAGPAARVRIAMAFGKLRRQQLPIGTVDYWALGGSHRRRILDKPGSKPFAAYCGAAQGLVPEQTGAHGCDLLTWTPEDGLQRRFLETDAVRWSTVVIDARDVASRSELCRRLVESAGQRNEDVGGRHTLVWWHVRGLAGPLDGMPALELERWLLAELQRAEAAESRIASVAVEVEPPELDPNWLEEDSLLGEFLRMAQQAAEDAAADNPERFGGHKAADLLRKMATADSQQTGERRLREIAAVGLELLRPAQ